GVVVVRQRNRRGASHRRVVWPILSTRRAGGSSVSGGRLHHGGVEQRGCNAVVVGDAGQRDLPAARRKLETGRLRADTGGRVRNATIAVIMAMVGSVTPAFAQSATKCEPAASMAQPVRDSVGDFKALRSRE